MRAVFLDRDGVLNRDGPGYVTAPEGLELLPGAARAVRELQDLGLRTVVVTNQSGIGRGLMTEADLVRVHEKLISELEREGAGLDGIYWCPHRPDENCSCRKPRPGLLLMARQDLGLDLARSYMVGDKPTDIECGASQGCRTVLVLSGLRQSYNPEEFAVQPDHVCADLPAAVRWIANDLQNGT